MLLCTEEFKQSFIQWIQTINPLALIVYGKNGIGKTITTKSLIIENGFKIISINPHCPLKKNKETIEEIFKCQKKTVIIIDNITWECIHDYLSNFKNGHLLFIVNTVQKRILKKKVSVLEFQVTQEIVYKFVYDYLEKNNIKYYKIIIKYIVEHVDTNIEQLMYILYEVPKVLTDFQCSQQQIMKYLMGSKKDKHYTLNDACEELIEKKNSIREKICIGSIDSHNISLLLFENYTSFNKDIHNISRITDLFSCSDIVQNELFNCKWETLEYYTLIGSIYPLHYFEMKKHKELKYTNYYNFLAKKQRNKKNNKNFSID